MRAKVFNIGFPKTGTMSLGRALKILGYRLCPHIPAGELKRVHGLPVPVTQEGLAGTCLPLAERYDAFRNIPWTLLYRELDRAFPGSKFILSRREPEGWVTSVAKHFGTKTSALTDFVYGPDRPPVGNEALYIERYQRHNAAVLDYFKDRPQDLLVLDLELADWRPLCSFLGRRRPLLRGYPHRNRADLRARHAGKIEKLFTYHVQEWLRPLTRSRKP